VIFLIFGLWIYSFFYVPTFDLDESLYRRVAEEMKWNGNFWHPVWDTRALNHKPPFFYWLVVLFSKLFDGADAGVSILAARFPSFLATLGIIFSLGSDRGFNKTSFLNTFLLWGCALFPLATSTSVLFDPLQTLAFIPCLLIPHRAFSENRSIKRKELLLIALSMFAATAIKGLTGLILPSLAIGLHLVLSDYKTTFKEGLRFFIFSFLPATLLSTLYYLFLDQKMGRAFTEEFFLVHHLGRGTQAMEAHHGPFYYYIGIILIGGGLLIPLLAKQVLRTGFNFKCLGFPFSYSIATLVFFSISATKLPHYTWPIWPALLLQLITLQNKPSKLSRWSESSIWKIFLIPIFSLGLALFWFALNPEIVSQTEIDSSEILMFSIGATLCIMIAFLFKRFMKQPEFIALFMALITVSIAIPASSISERILVTPFFEVAHELKKYNPKSGECIRDSGPNTATLSLALGKELGRDFTHNRCEPEAMKYLISPTSKKAECAERKMSVLLEGKTLTLCGKI